MTFYGLADYRHTRSELGEVVELFALRGAADQALEEVLRDEPSWAGQLSVVPEFELSQQ